MSPTESTPSYPIAYFLHSPHAAPKTLQSVLSTPILLKQRRAWLPGYLPAPNSTVGVSSTGIGEWQDEDEVRGVVYYIQDAEQERRLAEHVGDGCEVQEVDFQVCCGGMFGMREWVGGRAFVVCENREEPSGLEEIREEEVAEMRAQDTNDAAQLVSTSKKEKRKGLLRRITEPLRPRPAPDEPGEVEGSRRKPAGLFRRIISNLGLSTDKAKTGVSSGAVEVCQEDTSRQDMVVQEDSPPRRTPAPQIVVTDTSSSYIEYQPNADPQEVQKDVDVKGESCTA